MHYTAVTLADEQERRRRMRGRAAGLAAFGLLVSACVGVWSLQICLQVWAKNHGDDVIDCATGVLGLVDGITLARQRASKVPTEQGALTAFRDTIAAPWSLYPAVERGCRASEDDRRRLREVERLRYAEEHAVRYRATDLTRRRQSVASLTQALRAPGPLEKAAPPGATRRRKSDTHAVGATPANTPDAPLPQ